MHELPRRTDVVIIGAGFAGTATASALEGRGMRNFVVLEREERLAAFASGRGAGIARQLADDDDTTELCVRSTHVWRNDPDPGGLWTRTGGLLTFEDEALAAEYEARAKRFGVQADAIDPKRVRAEWELELPIVRALHVPTDGVWDIAKLLAMHTAYIKDRIALSTSVERIEPDPLRTVVVTNRGEIGTRVVVDASGAWAGSLVGAPPLAALKRHLYVIEGVPSQKLPYLWHLGSREIYLRRDGNNTLVSPCDATPSEPGHQEADASGEALLRAKLPAAKVIRGWACQRTFTPNRTMRLGRDPDRPWLVWAVGLGGHGATASSAAGQRVAEAVLEVLGRGRR